jgi:hypothetical protein
LKLVLKLSLCILDTIALKYETGLHKLVAMIFAVSFEITPIIQGAVGNESCYSMKNTLIIITYSIIQYLHYNNFLGDLEILFYL